MGIFFASFFKLALIPLLGVLLLVPRKKGWGPFVLGSAAFLGLQFGSYTLQNDLYLQFLNNSTGLVEPGPLNPSAMMFSRAIFGFMGVSVANAIYALFALVTTFFLLRHFWPKKDHSFEFAPLDLFIGGCLFYATVMPRFKDYSYIMLIFPTYWILNHLLQKDERTKWIFVFFVVVHLFAYQSWVLGALLFYWWFQKSLNRPENSLAQQR